MGIPYSREINAAFEQVTPLVAAGFKVLRTIKDIAVLLAVIQVLTVFLLGLNLFVLLAIVYSVNPDLEDERRILVTPLFKWLAGVSIWGILQTTVAMGVGFIGFVVIGLMLAGGRKESVLEQEGKKDADKAINDLGEEEKKNSEQEKNEKGKKNKKKGKKGKGEDTKGNEEESSEKK
ncbi:hypothetical protein B0J11DRAFT_35861 [Dendryphion nanum]|uniref:Uncharacterized protein n=1 Tax=Dendryphion nanum TaxID=256645 RepID=A0A9P9EKI2_9PLEO|nr:hypothetical protein B0J11DRAFT_35861 [Dendryphion nanum]